jgi:hypothetical protein
MAISKINSRSIQDGTVVGADITPGTVTNAKISPSAAIANAKLANSSITISGSSVSLGGSVTVNAAIDWQAVTVADGSTTVNCVAGKGYFLDTNAGVIEAFLPTSPTRGDRVVLADYSGTFATNQAIVNTGGELLDSTAGNDFKLTTNNTIAEFIYVDSAKGWLVYLNQAAGTTPSLTGNELSGVYSKDPSFIAATGGTITDSGDYRIHTFTGDGCFVVTNAGVRSGTSGSDTVDYLVIAGGGAAGGGSGGGGGAGGYRESHCAANSGCYTASPLATPTGITLTATTYPITVGGGGSPAGDGGDGGDGSTSIFSTITSAGGGGGDHNTCGKNGGSGGGAGYTGGCGGAGNTPTVSPPQGQPGGNNPGLLQFSAGGGGGAGAAGQNRQPSGEGGNGGNGVTTSISQTPTAYAGGGGASSGGVQAGPKGPTSGGIGGGGPGMGWPRPGPGTSGTANTGGGSGSGFPSSGAGGKGIVIIRYKFQ